MPGGRVCPAGVSGQRPRDLYRPTAELGLCLYPYLGSVYHISICILTLSRQ